MKQPEDQACDRKTTGFLLPFKSLQETDYSYTRTRGHTYAGAPPEDPIKQGAPAGGFPAACVLHVTPPKYHSGRVNKT